MHKSARPLILAVLSLFCSLTLAADLPTKAQKNCILALEDAGAGVAEAATNNALRCIRKVSQGELAPGAAAACLATESRDLKRARAATVTVAAKKCATLPDFGPASAAQVNAAFASPVDFSAIFGTDLGLTLQSKSMDRALASCQSTAAAQVAAVSKVELADYRQCLRGRLAKGQIASTADLEACMGVETPSLIKARKNAAKQIAAQCKTVPIKTALPGKCATSASTDELGSCLAVQANCDASTAVNGADRLARIAHRFKDGVATYYCGVRPQTSQSVARQWDEEILDAIRIDTPRPPVHARNLHHFATAMYDAWAAYDSQAKPYLSSEHLRSTHVESDRETAISFAAYQVLSARYSEKLSMGHEKSRLRFRARMSLLGLDPDYAETASDNPAAVGNRIAADILEMTLNDGARESTNYNDPSYTPRNEPLIVKDADIVLKDGVYTLDYNRWQPLALDQTVTQNGIPLPDTVQTYIGAQWNDVKPFALSKASGADLYFEPGPPPKLGGAEDARFKAEVLQVIEMASYLDPKDPTTLDISPAALGNNPLGTNDGSGYAANPVTGKAYAPQVVKWADFARVLAEFWADGPTSETPPGHWNTIANAVADHPAFVRRIGGAGQVLGPLEWDVKTYFALNSAVHDAAIACWGAKRKYDGVRPITMIRAMAKFGQSSDPKLPSYSSLGLPLQSGLVELITAHSSAPGQRHAHLVTTAAGGKVGDVAIFSWPGSPTDPKTQVSGVRWILGKAWVPYQRNTFVTPAFPGYFSGHSTFSRSAAEVLAAITGSPYFPGGLMEYVVKKDASLIHEQGPTQDVRLQWASYFDASDQSGQSRLWGGIHVLADDYAGRLAGSQIGLDAYAKSVKYFEGDRP